MPPKKERGTKTETLSLRLDPKTKFMLEFVARINGQTLTTVIERAIRISCREVTIGSDRLDWEYFWDPDVGVRTLKLLAYSDYASTYEEDELRRFTKAHWEFFYIHPKSDEPRRAYVEILWPKIEEYQRIWRDQRNSNYWAAGEAMAADLSAAQLKVPNWPRASAESPAMPADSSAAQPARRKPLVPSAESAAMPADSSAAQPARRKSRDDEIPF
jgi:hypothetical protein